MCEIDFRSVPDNRAIVSALSGAQTFALVFDCMKSMPSPSKSCQRAFRIIEHHGCIVSGSLKLASLKCGKCLVAIVTEWPRDTAEVPRAICRISIGLKPRSFELLEF